MKKEDILQIDMIIDEHELANLLDSFFYLLSSPCFLEEKEKKEKHKRFQICVRIGMKIEHASD